MMILLGGVVLLVLLALVAPYFLNVDHYWADIAGAIESATGRKVSIAGIHARFLPSVGFDVEDFHLSNPSGFPAGDLVSAQAIRGNLAFWPLLRRDFQIRSIELVHPKLTLLDNDRGETNYTFAAKAGAKGKRTEATDPSSGESSFRIDEVAQLNLTAGEMSLGHIGVRDRAPATSLHLRNLNVSLAHVAIDPLALKKWQGDAKLDGTVLELPGWKEPLTFQSGTLTLREGRVESDFRANLGKVADLKGSVRVADLEHAVPTFNISTTQLDVDRLLAAQGESRPDPPPAKTAGSELLAQGRITAERLRWQPYTANNATAEVRLFTDRMELWPLSLELYGGTLQVSARANRAETPQRFSANVQVRGVDVGKMMAAAGGQKRITGTGELTLQLFGALSPAWHKALSGNGSFAIRDGKLPAVDLSGMAGSLEKLSGFGGETPFSVLQGDLEIAGARVNSRQIHLDSARGTVDLKGSISLDGALDYQGQAVLTPGAVASSSSQNPLGAALGGILGNTIQTNVGRVTVPFAVRGTVSNPKFEPGRGMPSFQAPATAKQPAAAQSPQKSILDLFRKP